MGKTKRIGILTGGGDCAGLNAVIRAVFRTAHNIGWQVLGIEESFGGLLQTKKTRLMKPKDVRGILHTGGQPTNFDRLLGTRFGSAAVRLARDGGWGRMVALAPPAITSVPLKKAVGRLKRVPPGSDIIRAARDLGTSFGEEPSARAESLADGARTRGGGPHAIN